MSKWKYALFGAFLAVGTYSLQGQVQTPPAPAPKVGGNATVGASDAAVRVSQEDPAAVKRGGDAFAAMCGQCHGATAKGTDIAPDLIRSTLVEDDDKGNLIGPVLCTEHPKGGTKLNLTDQQISDIAAWLRVQVYGAAFRQTYVYQNILVGDAAKGKVYFDQKCASCHSVTGDLAGIGAKYDAPTLQAHWITGGGGGRGGRGRGGIVLGENGSTEMDTTPPTITKSTVTITVTLASGQTFTGVPLAITDFNVTFRDMNGVYHSYIRSKGYPKVEVHNPLQAHAAILRTLNDEDMHNVTAYLAGLK